MLEAVSEIGAKAVYPIHIEHPESFSGVSDGTVRVENARKHTSETPRRNGHLREQVIAGCTGSRNFQRLTPSDMCEVTYPQELGVKMNTGLQTHACKNRTRDLVLRYIG